MKIDDSIKTVAAIPMNDAAARTGKAGHRVEWIAALHNSGDSVQLSPQLQNIEKSFTNGEVFNAARVEEIKRAISEGQFIVNPDKVADRLIETVRDLIQTKQA
ncbi:MAG: flagellar biosynthesis anti-sigma factor FlgM [Nitrosospira sp.]|nr:flagellar biosynthesis anti-sigma factor FlgM [Nitrosospira sp.]MDN5881585.1 flagellar biosynthesis anti-sigma factor FlgM [Nitrosospira sp.]MDN5934862.1 flagellar biosynthesis anti-sigma factor FlgM [Nitrosospira sp.]